ncbi:predicted protein [Chaetomium globosum CBS 148.51]|uniref:Uncharacterized protein n=1 Tax=Chaetomium globosum (strain ATCC 6205 / CBS 148.51 / DSM 1962 / NBRC 6347 / NRRL 1970) TaxID=306901 RepID=Q2HHG1_CHAGB|nr:uncharacterized protein CHGG_00343 [Chaetomium globosum CBS 148.51]EAQ92108.1 predicted protein [Chaetomium globosum CBS 148.51]
MEATMHRPLVIARHRNRISSRIRNPANRSRFTINHNIRPFLNKIKHECGFNSIEDVTNWLKSDEVFPWWQEFRRDCLQQFPPLTTRCKFSSPVTGRVEQRVYHRRAFLSISAVTRLLEDEDLFKKLQRAAGDKRSWAFNCHVAWFVAQVYAKCWDAKRDEGSLCPLVREDWEGDDGRQPWLWVYPLVYTLKYLSVIEERQPGWGVEFGDEDDYFM